METSRGMLRDVTHHFTMSDTFRVIGTIERPRSNLGSLESYEDIKEKKQNSWTVWPRRF